MIREPDKRGKEGKAWVSHTWGWELPMLWLINLPNFHPMLQWFSVGVSNEDPQGWHEPEIWVHHVDPESYLFTELDPDKFKEQKITMLPNEVLKHQIPLAVYKKAAHVDELVCDFVQEILDGRLKPDHEEQKALHDFLVNAEQWLAE